jgi:hypothetical protein
MDELETLVGPLLQIFTRLAHYRDVSLACDVQSRLLALARRRDVAIDLRLTAGAIVLEANSVICRPP